MLQANHEDAMVKNNEPSAVPGTGGGNPPPRVALLWSPGRFKALLPLRRFNLTH